VQAERKLGGVEATRLAERRMAAKIAKLEKTIEGLQTTLADVTVDHDLLMFEVGKWRERSTGS
jgi:hypothetical protein